MTRPAFALAVPRIGLAPAPRPCAFRPNLAIRRLGLALVLLVAALLTVGWVGRAVSPLPVLPLGVPKSQPKLEQAPALFQKPVATPPPAPAPAHTVAAAPQPVQVWCLVTAYSPHDRRDAAHWSAGDGRTAYAPRVAPRGIAVPHLRDARGRAIICPYTGTSIPIWPKGSLITVPGYGTAALDDTGGTITTRWQHTGTPHLDVRFTSEREALAWGPARWCLVTITPQQEPTP